MSTLNVDLSEDLHSQVVMLAAHDGVTPSEFIADTLAEKLAALEVESYSTGQRSLCDGSPVVALSTVVRVPALGAECHEHLAPYHEE